MHPPTFSSALRRGTTAATALVALLATVTVAADAEAHPVAAGGAAHEELRSAVPGEGDDLAAAPTALRLTFINAIRLPSAHLSLTGPEGAVELGELRRAADAAHVLVAPITGRLVAGGYTVHWQVAGPDGHPVRGEYTFTILPGATGLAPPDPVADTQPPGTDEVGEAEPGAGPFPVASDFDAESPTYVAVRWLTFLGLLGAIGTVSFRLLVLTGVRRSNDPAGEALVRDATPRALTIGLSAAIVLAVALLARLYAQSYALHGPAGALDPSAIADLLGGTAWSLGWWLQAVGTAMAMCGFLLARRRAPGGWWLAAAGVVPLAFSPAFSGHAAAVTGLVPLAVLADGLHVLGAGGWLGSLLVVAVAGLPAALGRNRRGEAVASLINAFSPTALFFAGMVVATGIFSAWLHLGTVPALWTSGYGRTLLLKVGVLCLLFGTGAYNWLRVKPALGEGNAAGRLRRSAAFELAVAVVVLAVTAVLVATPPP